MKLVTFKKDPKVSCGVPTDKGIADLAGIFEDIKQLSPAITSST